jgi:hypothetical protein
VTYSVEFAIDLAPFPDGVRQQIEKTMWQIAEVVSTVPPSSPFWSSMKESVLQIDVEGVRIGYRIDRARGQIRVIEAQPVR